MSNRKVKMQIAGIDGNAFAVLGAVRKAMRRQGFTQDEIAEFTQKATSGNYDHLLATVMEYTEEPDEDIEELVE